MLTQIVFKTNSQRETSPSSIEGYYACVDHFTINMPDTKTNFMQMYIDGEQTDKKIINISYVSGRTEQRCEKIPTDLSEIAFNPFGLLVL